MATTIVCRTWHKDTMPCPHVLTDSDDIKNVDLTKIHNLSGPIAVEGAEPGDCLVVDILDGIFFRFNLGFRG